MSPHPPPYCQVNWATCLLPDEADHVISARTGNEALIMEPALHIKLWGLFSAELWGSHKGWQAAEHTHKKSLMLWRLIDSRVSNTHLRCAWFVLEVANSAGRDKPQSADERRGEVVWMLCWFSFQDWEQNIFQHSLLNMTEWPNPSAIKSLEMLWNVLGSG